MPLVINAMQAKKGVKSDYTRMGTLTQPIQFLPKEQKDKEWGCWNMDWFEMEGLRQLRRNARKLLKNYKLANSIIDRTDYIVEEDNQYADLVDIITKEDASALELKFYPIIPNVINVLVGEFAKRSDKVQYVSTDEASFNEMLEEKRAMIEQTLVKEAEMQLAMNMINQGADPESEEFKQALSPENIKSLPQIEEFFKKDYRSMVEQWADHQHQADTERFKLKELEIRAFRDMLVGDREFWHFRMDEDDYEVELWNPILTFYHKSPDIRYISQGNFVGKIELHTVSDIIDRYGYLMDDEQLRSLESIYPKKAAGYPIQGYQNDGTFYDGTRSHQWNVSSPSLGFRQFTSVNDYFLAAGDDIITSILNESEDLSDFGTYQLLRVTSVYWKSQRMIGHLTKIDPETGMKMQEVISEDYVITIPPVYDTAIMREKNAETLKEGEHIQWIWINQVWGGLKVGPNRPSFYGNADYMGIQPIYLNIGPVKFQFKGDFTLYGCKLPVEGSVFTDRNSRSMSLVDKMKPFQIGYNLVNNQIADILVDELGTVIMLDQNALPKHSAGEDWGKNNYAKAYVAMKDFQMLPLDTSITNTENPLAFQHYQVLNLEQTQRMMSRIQLGTYFKNQAYEVIGITPQRMGQVNSQETATGIEQSVNASYSQTEMYFVQHSEHLMPRVHQMRTDLAQFYNSRRPSTRLSYMTSKDEKVNFEINGTELLSRDLNVFVSTKINHKQVMEQIKQMAIQNNTAGASIYDLASIVKAESMAEVTHAMKSIEQKTNAQRQEQQQHEQQMQQQQLKAQQAAQEAKQRFEAEQAMLDRQTQIQVAEIKGASFPAQDMNSNQQSDYMEALDSLEKKRQQDDLISLKREAEINKNNRESQKMNIKQQEIQSRQEIAEKQLEIARTNKNKYDSKSKKK
jgi:hypothetical protein